MTITDGQRIDLRNKFACSKPLHGIIAGGEGPLHHSVRVSVSRIFDHARRQCPEAARWYQPVGNRGRAHNRSRADCNGVSVREIDVGEGDGLRGADATRGHVLILSHRHVICAIVDVGRFPSRAIVGNVDIAHHSAVEDHQAALEGRRIDAMINKPVVATHIVGARREGRRHSLHNIGILMGRGCQERRLPVDEIDTACGIEQADNRCSNTGTGDEIVWIGEIGGRTGDHRRIVLTRDGDCDGFRRRPIQARGNKAVRDGFICAKLLHRGVIEHVAPVAIGIDAVGAVGGTA